jgi:homoserine O-succinyltransferase
MPLFLDTACSGSAAGLNDADSLAIAVGFVNNMPDAAGEATERQFLDLLRAAAPDADIRLTLFSIPDMPRGDALGTEFSARYRDIAELWESRLDALIVTGTEPRAAKLKDEPYWPTMARLVDWARDNTRSAIWSCLAAHAAVLHTEGIERRPLSDKKFGVFDCETIADHPLMNGVNKLRVPHSRYNGLPAAGLAMRGYRLLSQSVDAGVDAFVREEGGSLFVFFQGHPEYEAETLLREFRRDVGRYLRAEREQYPALPHGYFGKDATALLNIFHARARAVDDRRAGLMADFPFAALAAGLESPWRSPAIAVYQNWIDYLLDRTSERRSSAASLHRHYRVAGASRAETMPGG